MHEGGIQVVDVLVPVVMMQMTSKTAKLKNFRLRFVGVARNVTYKALQVELSMCKGHELDIKISYSFLWS